MRRRPTIASGTKAEYARVARRLLAWRAGSGGSDNTAVSEYVSARRAAGAAPRTVALEMRVLGAATRWAALHAGALQPPVLPRIRIDPKVFACNHSTPTPAQAAAAIRAMPDDDWRLAMRLIATTGARVGEIVSLRSVDFDAFNGRLALGASEGASKTGMRWFPLDAATLRALEGREGRGRGHLLNLGTTKTPIKQLQRNLTRACDRASVPRFTPHGLRRMVVSRLVRAHVDPATAASLTGHSIEIMLKHYREVNDEDRRLAAEKAMLGVLDELPRDR